MEKTMYLILLCLSVGILSWIIRAMPFLLFSRRTELPPLVLYVGRVLSPAAIAMLVVYCFASYVNNRPPAAHWWGLAEAAAGVLTILLQLRFRNPLLSIILGTGLYMTLIRWF